MADDTAETESEHAEDLPRQASVGRRVLAAFFWLLASLSGVAGLYITLDADFLGGTQVLIYIGGILVLILFGIMMTQRDPVLVEATGRKKRSVFTAILVSSCTFGALMSMILSTDWQTSGGRTSGAVTTPDLGRALLTDYILPFEIVSVLLLVVLCGSAYVARRREEVPHA